MEIVGAVASITTLVALAKELSTIAYSVLHGLQHAPKELIHVANQMSLISLELECIKQTQDPTTDAKSILTAEESRILDQSLTIAKTTITAIHRDCKKHSQPRNRMTSRISWALFDSKTVNEALDQLHKTEAHLSLVLQIINTKRSFRAHDQNTKQSALVLQELKEIRGQAQLVKQSPRVIAAVNDLNRCIAFRYQGTKELPETWKQVLGSNIRLTTSQNDFQASYEFYARFPVLTFGGCMALVLCFTLRRMWGFCPNISVLGGGINTVNIICEESDIVLACQQGDLLTVRNLFLQKKAAANDMTTGDRTLLYYAVQSGSVELVRFLINAGTPVLSRQLLSVSYWRQPESARVLLHHGANVETISEEGLTAAAYLFGPRRPRSSQIEFIDILACNSFSQFDAQDRDGWTTLHRAAAWGTSAAVRKLLELRVSVNQRSHKLDWTPVFCAVCFNNMDALQELWDSCEDLQLESSSDARGWNLLHVAAGYGNFEAIPYLLKRGVNIYEKSIATTSLVPSAIRGKCVTPTEVARSCGMEAYTRWVEALDAVGIEVDIRPDEVNWMSDYPAGRLGKCECCDVWDE